MRQTSTVFTIVLCIVGFLVSPSLYAMEFIWSRFLSIAERKKVKTLKAPLQNTLEKWDKLSMQERAATKRVAKFLEGWGGRFKLQRYHDACAQQDSARQQLKQRVEAVSDEVRSLGQQIEQEQNPEALVELFRKYKNSMGLDLCRIIEGEPLLTKCCREHQAELQKVIKECCPANGGRAAYRIFLESIGAPQEIFEQEGFLKSWAEDF